MVLKKKNISSWLSSLVISFILFSNLGIGNAKYLSYVIFLMSFSILYIFFISIKKFKNIKKVIVSLPFMWFFLCESLIFIYGYFGKNKQDYSLSFHFFSMLSIFLVLIILYHKYENILEIVIRANIFTAIYLSLFIVISGIDKFKLFFSGNFIRIGETAVGNVNTTAITYTILLIPNIYKLIIERKKTYIIIVVVCLFFMFITGSKKAVFSVLIMCFICMFRKEKNQKLKNIFKGFLLVGMILLMCYLIPSLHEIIFKRVVGMFEILSNYDSKDTASTNVRMTFIISALKNSWDKPFFGHGWEAFRYTYGTTSHYPEGTYSHCNYTEILFTFGTIGFVIFYFFPFYIANIWKKIRRYKESVLVALYFFCLLFIDIGAVTFYYNILWYIGFIIAYILAKKCINKRKYNNKNRLLKS